MRLLALRIVTVALAVAFPLAAYAAPAPVTGLKAQMTNGQVQVQWDAVTDEEVAYYQIYFSRESILENDGLYDDFETTSGPVTTHILSNIPQGTTTLYVAVLAVNPEGQDSGVFAEEVSVQVTTGAASTSAAASGPTLVSSAVSVASAASSATTVSSKPAQSQPLVTILELRSASVVSATGVVLTFNAHPVISGATDAPSAFSIIDASGSILPIKSIVIQGNEILVVTEVHEQARPYQVRVTEPLKGEGNLPLSPSMRTAIFFGHPDGVPSRPIPSLPNTPTVPGAVRDISNFHMKATAQSNGMFAVEAGWTYDVSKGDLAGYVVRQSRDGGRTFSDPQTLPPTVGGLQLTDVSAGEFGVSVQTLHTSGGVSKGVFQTITLTRTGGTTPVGSVTNDGKGKGKGNLPNSGAGAVGLAIAVSGGLAGLRKVRKSKLA